MPMSRDFGPMWWHGRFRGCGYRMTVPREVILNVLSKSDKHLSAEDIYMKVHTRYPVILEFPHFFDNRKYNVNDISKLRKLGSGNRESSL